MTSNTTPVPVLNAGRAGKTLFGAILGGVIGHQFGSGRGNDAATVAGTLIGAAVANGGDRRPYYQTTEYSRPVTRCETNYRTHQEERIDGYDVVYKYHGRTYATRTPFDPGQEDSYPGRRTSRQPDPRNVAGLGVVFPRCHDRPGDSPGSTVTAQRCIRTTTDHTCRQHFFHD